MILQLSPHIPLKTPKGEAIAHFLIDYGCEEDLYWVCFINETGECWTFSNRDIRALKNITHGRLNDNRKKTVESLRKYYGTCAPTAIISDED